MAKDYGDPADVVQTICDQCFRVSCWKGENLCSVARGAGTIDVTPQVINLLREFYAAAWIEAESWGGGNQPSISEAFSKDLALNGLKAVN